MTARWTLAAFVGAANAGKTSLVQALSGVQVGAITRKAHTTRVCARAATMVGEVQVVMVDAPGEPTARTRADALDTMMRRAAYSSIDRADSIIVVVDAARRDAMESSRRTLDRVIAADRKAMVALNKVDLLSPERLMTLARAFWDTGAVCEIFMTSATKRKGLAPMLRALAGADGAHVGKAMEGVRSLDDPSLAAEITREHVFHRFHQELPYGVAIKPEVWRELRLGRARVEQTALVVHERHRRMVIGHKGAALRALGQAAREDMERVFDRGLDLFIHVQVAPWRTSSRALIDLGLRDDGGLV